MEEKNTSMTVIIVIIVLLIVGLIAYFVMNNMQGEEAEEPQTAENDTIDDTSDKEVDVTGAYTGTYNKNSNIAEDAADAITDNDSDRVVVELLLEEDGTATFVKEGDTNLNVTGTYTHNNEKVTLTVTGNDNTTDENTADNETNDNTDDTNAEETIYEFNINIDGSLSYKDDSTSTDTVTLNKTDKENLEYIK